MAAAETTVVAVYITHFLPAAQRLGVYRPPQFHSSSCPALLWASISLKLSSKAHLKAWRCPHRELHISGANHSCRFSKPQPVAHQLLPNRAETAVASWPHGWKAD